MHDLSEVRSAILANAEPREATVLRAKWAAEQGAAPKIVTTAANYLEARVSEKQSELNAIQLERERQESLHNSYELKTKTDLLRGQFKEFISHNAATVLNGELHFQFNGAQYSVSLREQVYFLKGADGLERKLQGEGPASEKLVFTLATL